MVVLLLDMMAPHSVMTKTVNWPLGFASG